MNPYASKQNFLTSVYAAITGGHPVDWRINADIAEKLYNGVYRTNYDYDPDVAFKVMQRAFKDYEGFNEYPSE